MTSDRPTPQAAAYAMYSDLAAWWPLLSPPSDYADEAAEILGLLRSSTPGAQTLLELGSGGGNNAVHLKSALQVTLSDSAADMLAVSQELNPECDHVLGDMRTLRLGRAFDAVLVHDAVDYMVTTSDLAACIRTGVAHLRPGGTLLLLPDATTESYEESTAHGGSSRDDGSGIRYLEWHHALRDDQPASCHTTYTYLLRDPAGEVTSWTETHEFGLFPRNTWLSLLAEAGLEAAMVTLAEDDHDPFGTTRVAFLGRRPTVAGPSARP
jgi:trans-aconitate methyltransferase